MRIGMVLPTKFPPDIRVEKEARVLSAYHDVYLLCTRRDDQITHDTWERVTIRRVFTDIQRWSANFQLMTTCVSFGWYRAIKAFVRDYQIEALHVHDLPTVGPALSVAREYAIPLIVDLHENYPQMIAAAQASSTIQRNIPSLVQQYLVSVDRWKRYEARVIPQATAVIVVIEEAFSRLIELGVPENRLVVVANYTSITDLEQTHYRPNVTNDYFNVVYAGGFATTRDLRTVIDAVAQIPREIIPNLRVQLLGGQGAEYRDLLAYSREKRMEQLVTILDWRPMSEVWQYINQSDICLVPHIKSAHTDSTIPHKLFQYMACQKPVIVSNCAPLARIVKESQCGLVYTSGCAQELAQAIITLYQNPEQRNEMGKCGHAAVISQYNWERASENLLQLYRSIK
jgi:glycosyltransferase involved in cell wall biosynthesis